MTKRSNALLTNALLFYTAQQRFDTIGGLGNPLIQTPHLDRLVRQGRSCTHATTPSPVCMTAGKPFRQQFHQANNDRIHPITAQQIEQQIQVMRQVYYAVISQVDAQVGLVLNELDRRGLPNNLPDNLPVCKVGRAASRRWAAEAFRSAKAIWSLVPGRRFDGLSNALRSGFGTPHALNSIQDVLA